MCRDRPINHMPSAGMLDKLVNFGRRPKRNCYTITIGARTGGVSDMLRYLIGCNVGVHFKAELEDTAREALILNRRVQVQCRSSRIRRS
jgi:hypothetical protein